MAEDSFTYTDTVLVQRLAAGSGEAFTEIYNRYWLAMCDAAYKRLEDKDMAQDVVQNVFIRLWASREKLLIENLEAYLMRSVRNGVIDVITKSRKPVAAFVGPFEEVLMENNTVEEQLAAKELMALVLAYAETLPGKRKQIFLLHIKEKLSTKEIAQALDVSQKTVQNQLRTALKDLEAYLPAILITILIARF